MRGRLILEDGTEYEGELFGAKKSVPGEVGKKKNVVLLPCFYGISSDIFSFQLQPDRGRMFETQYCL